MEPHPILSGRRDAGTGRAPIARAQSEGAARKEPTARRAISGHKLPKETLHPYIREEVWALCHRGKDDTAVFEAIEGTEVKDDNVIVLVSPNDHRVADVIR